MRFGIGEEFELVKGRRVKIGFARRGTLERIEDAAIFEFGWEAFGVGDGEIVEIRSRRWGDEGRGLEGENSEVREIGEPVAEFGGDGGEIVVVEYGTGAIGPIDAKNEDIERFDRLFKGREIVDAQRDGSREIVAVAVPRGLGTDDGGEIEARGVS